MSPPHDWEQPDWRVRSHSVQGIVNSAPMDYQQVINQMEESDLSKDKEMMSILEDIKAKSLFFGDSDGFQMSDTNLASLIPDVDFSDESKVMLTLLGKSSSNKSDDSHGHASIRKSSSNNSDDSHGDACIGKSSSNSSDDSHSHACIGIRKDYSTDDCTKSPVVEEQLQVIDPNQLYKVDRDDEMQKLSDKCENGWKYVATLKAYMESCSEEEEEGEETEILEVKQSSVSRMDVRKFYGKKVMEHMAASRDVYRLKLLKTFVARERAEKTRHRLNQSDSMHSDTLINSDNVSDISLVSNTTYSDESESMDKKKSKEEKQKEMKAAVAVVKTSEESDASLVPSVGSMWSGGTSDTESPKSSTETLSCKTVCSTDTGYTSKAIKGRMMKNRKLQNRKLQNIKDRNKKKASFKKKKERRNLGVVSGVEGDVSEAYGDGDGDGESYL